MTEINNDVKKDMTAAQMLFDARTVGRRKREISTISKLLCIREEYLIALENGDYKSIPELVYILGFARNYAMELGLDPDEIVCKIKEEMGIVEETDPFKDEENTEERPDDRFGNVAPHVKKEQQTRKKSMFLEKLSRFVYKNWKWLLAVLVALGIMIAGAMFLFSLDNSVPATSDMPEIVTATNTDPEYKVAVREVFGTENKETANVILQANSESWVKIEDARGNTVFSRVLVAGDVYYVPAGDKIRGTFGNAGGIDVWVNGIFAPKLGAMHTRKTNVLLNPTDLMSAEIPAPAATDN